MPATPLQPQKQHSSQKLQLFVMMALFAGIGVGAVGMGLAGNSRQPVGVSPSMQPRRDAVSEVKKVGEMIEVDNVSFGVDAVNLNQAADAVYKPNPGNRFVVVSVTIANKTTQQRPVVPVTQVYLKDQDGNTYFMSPAPMKNPIAAGNLLAGDNLKGSFHLRCQTRSSS